MKNPGELDVSKLSISEDFMDFTNNSGTPPFRIVTRSSQRRFGLDTINLKKLFRRIGCLNIVDVLRFN